MNIDVQNGVLTVSGESKISNEKDENGFVVRERRYGKFARSLQLPRGIKVCAEFLCGAWRKILTVAL